VIFEQSEKWRGVVFWCEKEEEKTQKNQTTVLELASTEALYIYSYTMSRVTVFNALQMKENKKVANKLMIASVCMFAFPVTGFYILQYFFQGSENVDMIAGFGAVAVANCVIAGYVVMAFNEEDPEGMVPQKVPAVGIWAAKKTD
jgi:hypothetical protein